MSSNEKNGGTAAKKSFFQLIKFGLVGIGNTLIDMVISTVLSIVPGNIGLKEAVLGVAASQMGALFQSGVAASLMQRAAVMIVYLVMGLAFAWPVWRRYTRGKKEELSHE